MTAEELLEQVAAQVRVCTKCDLYKGTKNGVPGEGDPHAEVMLIGEAPGFNEDRLGRPFVGPAGGFLDELLGIAGLKRPDVFIANVVKHRPPDNRDPLPEEIAACADYLTHQIAAIDPKVIVTLGRYSMARFFPGATISKIHGQFKLVDNRVVVAMYHPAAALAHARQLAAQGKLGNAAKPDKQDEADKPPEQLSLF